MDVGARWWRNSASVALLSGLLVLAGVGGQGVGAAANSPTLIDLGTLGGTSGEAWAANSNGQVVGDSSLAGDQATHAFIWTQADGMTDLGTLGGDFSQAFSINDSGQATGVSTTAGGDQHAFYWTQATGMVDLGTLGGSDSYGWRINSHGDITGWSTDAAGEQHVFVWTQSGGMTDLGTLAGDDGSSPTGINDDGEVTGDSSNDQTGALRPFIWTSAGGMVDISPPVGVGTGAAAISNSGQVVGQINIDHHGTNHAFSWTPAGGPQDIGTVDNSRVGSATAVNDIGQVVGYSRNSSGRQVGFIWSSDTGMVSLGTGTSEANAINDSGQAVGQGVPNAFMWTAGAGIMDLGSINNGGSNALNVNNSGMAVGFSWTNSHQTAADAVAWNLPDTPPGPPRNVTASGGNGSATVTWSAPLGDGGQPVDGYTVTASPGGESQSVDASTTSAVFSDLAQGQTYTFAVSASNSVGPGPASPPSNPITIGSPPQITSPSSASTAMRTPFDFTVTTTGVPAPALSEGGALPQGVTFTDYGDGTAHIAGSAAAGSAGTYPITISATNGIGSGATQAFTLTVTNAPSPPTIVDPGDQTATFGVPFSLEIDTTGFPTPKLTKSGTLPPGLTFTNNGDGTATIQGTPARSASGVYPIVVTAKNSAGTASQGFNLIVDRPPAISKIPNTKTSVGASVNVHITAQGYTTPSFGLGSSLPDGLAFTDNGDGTALISGVPQPGSGGLYTIIVTAGNPTGDTSASFSMAVDERPAFTSANSASASIGASFSFQISATGYPPPRFSKTGTLPKGVTFTAATGVISGTPKAGTAGTYSIVITARNAVGSATQSFTLTVS